MQQPAQTIESDDDYDDDTEDEEEWMDEAGSACHPRTVLMPAVQGSELAQGAGSWLQSSLDWMLAAGPREQEGPLLSASTLPGGHLLPRRPRGLIRTACREQNYDDQPDLTPPSPQNHRANLHMTAAGGTNGAYGGGGQRCLDATAPDTARVGMRKTRQTARQTGAQQVRGVDNGNRGGVQRKAGSIEEACCGRWFSRLSPWLVVGRKPKSVRELSDLKEEGVSSILSVIEAHEFEVTPSRVRQEGFHHLNIAVTEGQPLSVRQLQQGMHFIKSAMERDRRASVYVHCRRGRVRCVMMCTAFLMAIWRLDSIQAEMMVLNSHPFGKLRKAHRQVLCALHQSLAHHPTANGEREGDRDKGRVGGGVKMQDCLTYQR